jgi:hypothetical protein
MVFMDFWHACSGIGEAIQWITRWGKAGGSESALAHCLFISRREDQVFRTGRGWG